MPKWNLSQKIWWLMQRRRREIEPPTPTIPVIWNDSNIWDDTQIWRDREIMV